MEGPFRGPCSATARNVSGGEGNQYSAADSRQRLPCMRPAIGRCR